MLTLIAASVLLQGPVSWTEIERRSLLDDAGRAFEVNVYRVGYRLRTNETRERVWEVSRLLERTEIDGERVPPPAGLKPDQTEERWSLDGQLLGAPFTGRTAAEFRIFRALRPPFPLNQDRGTVISPAVSLGGLEVPRASWSLTASPRTPLPDGTPVVSWTLRYQEEGTNPMSGEGRAIAERTTGFVRSLTLTLRNAPGGDEPQTIRIERTREP